MFADKNDLRKQMLQSIDDGTLISPKHDKLSLGTPEPGYRTIVVPGEDGLRALFNSGDYSVKLYRNNNPKHPDPYVVITPNDSTFVSASGVPPMSPDPTHPCDVFVAVSGVRQGVHLYGEESSKVKADKADGTLTFLVDLL